MNYKKIIIQWMEFDIPKGFPRNYQIHTDSGFIISIIGPRRAGKTFLCYNLMHQLRKAGVSRENMLYVNFEDEKLSGACANDLSSLLETYFEIFGLSSKDSVYLFLDEIQNVENWDKWVRRIHETEKKIKIILTGSSAKLLSKELSTHLRGRTIPVEVFPLSFLEIVQWQKLDFDHSTISHSKKRFAIKKVFDKYLTDGGFPSIFFEDDCLKENVLQEYFNSMIFRDVVERYRVNSIKKLKMLSHFVFESVAKDISYSRLANKMSSAGLAIGKHTVIEYMSYLEDAYLFFQNLKFEYSLTKQLGAIKKVYCIDNGLLNAVSFKFVNDTGKLLENLVYLELRRKHNNIFYHRKNYECDFLIQEKNTITKAFQVTHELNSDNEKREIRGLTEVFNTYKLNEGIILTADQESELKINNKTIKIIPLWKWLLEK